jgi:hypothetical protein
MRGLWTFGGRLASGQTIAELDPLDPTLHRISPKTLVANHVFACLAGVTWYSSFLLFDGADQDGEV